MSPERQDLHSADVKQLIAQRVAETIAAYESGFRMACDLINQGTFQEAESINNKRKLENNQGNKRIQEPLRKPKLAKIYTARPSDRKAYAGKLPLCSRCKLHHNGPCTVKCRKCQKVGHMTTDCRSKTFTEGQTVPRNNRKADVTCFRCEKKGHYMNECKERKDQGKVNNQGKRGAWEN